MRIALLSVLLGLVLFQEAASQVPEGPPDETSQATLEEGKGLYGGAGLCFACHGPQGKGVPGAGVDLTDDEWLHDDGSYATLVARILKGVGADETKSGIIMLPRGGSQITESQAEAIARYLWAIQRR